MTRYRKKPVEVEAWQVGSDEPMPEWVFACAKNRNDSTGLSMHVLTINGSLICAYGDVLVWENGVITPWTLEDFEQTYEVVEVSDGTKFSDLYGILRSDEVME